MSASTALAHLARCESAISSLEYALLLAFISVALIAAVLGLGDGVSQRYDSGSEALRTAGSG